MVKTTILFSTDVLYRMAGAEKNLFEVATRLDPSKYRVIVMCFTGGEAAETVRKRGIEVIDLKLKGIYLPISIIKGWGIFKLIKQRNVKIVVTYHESSDFLMAIIAKFARVPIIISSRRDMGYRLKRRHIFVYKFINKLFDRIFTVSDAVKNKIFDREGVLWHKLVTVHNGVELEKFSLHVDKGLVKQSLGLENNRPIVGILAALRPIKGHKYFIEAASIILKEFPEVYFLIVGWADDPGYYKELQDYTTQLNIEKNVLFVGGYSNSAEMLSIMDISVLSSINEGFSNALLESMAAGKPVVATNAGGTPEAVIDGETGILVPAKDSRVLADAVLTLLRNKELAEKMGQNGRKRVENIFSIDKMIENLENLYETLLSMRGNKEERHIFINSYSLIRIFVKIIKFLVYSFFYYSGLNSIINWYRGGNKGIKILAYHRVSNNDFDPMGMCVKVENFERQIRYIKECYNPISLEKAIELLKGKRRIPERSIVITFDDGYKDNYLNAYPIFKKYGIPATIFLSVDAVDQQKSPWYDTIVNALNATNKSYINFMKYNQKEYSLVSHEDRLNASQEIVLFAKYIKNDERQKLVKELLQELDVDCTEDNYMLDWKDINDMNNNGLSFGSHGLSHSILTTLAKEEVRYEIRKSKSLIKERTGIEVNVFAYPNGGPNDFNETAIEALKENSYLAACTLIKGSNKKTVLPFELRRYCVTQGMITGLFGGFSKSLLEFKIL